MNDHRHRNKENHQNSTKSKLKRQSFRNLSLCLTVIQIFFLRRVLASAIA